MRRIIHLSDLHFGADEPAIAEGLLRDIERQSTHLLVVSGDLTQRARGSQFADAERIENYKKNSLCFQKYHSV